MKKCIFFVDELDSRQLIEINGGSGISTAAGVAAGTIFAFSVGYVSGLARAANKFWNSL